MCCAVEGIISFKLRNIQQVCWLSMLGLLWAHGSLLMDSHEGITVSLPSHVNKMYLSPLVLEFMQNELYV